MASASNLAHNFSNMAATIFLKKDFRLEELKVFEAATSFGGILPGLGFSAIKARFLLITLLSAEQRKLTSLLSTKINFYLHSAIFRLQTFTTEAKYWADCAAEHGLGF